MKKYSTKEIAAIAFILIFAVVGIKFCFDKYYAIGPAVVVSISSDGQYIISSHSKSAVVLWNIKDKSKQIISREANIFSAYFIRGGHDFMWQDTNNIVRVQNFDGKNLKTVKTFRVFPTYGHVMTTDLSHYIASDNNWSIYESFGKDLKKIKKGFSGYNKFGKLLNLTLSNDDKYLLTSGTGSPYDKLPLSAGQTLLDAGLASSIQTNKSLMNGVVLWSVETGKPVVKYMGASGKSFAIFNPSASLVIGGDEVTRAYIWNTQTAKLVLQLWDIWVGKSVTNTDSALVQFDNKGLLPVPASFQSQRGNRTSSVLAFKFINNTDLYLRFTLGVPYAILYTISDPKPQKYLSLGSYPWPSVNQYGLDETIDSAPKTGTLVTGQANGQGINVYQYDATKRALNLVWSPGA